MRLKATFSEEKRTRLKRRIAAILIVCIFAVVTYVTIANFVMLREAEPYILTPQEAEALAHESGEADCILVLGASVTDAGPSGMLADRLDKGMELFALGVSRLLLMSGDNGTVEYNEVQRMKEYVLEQGAELGLAEENIYLDHAGFSTYDSAYRVRAVFQAKRVVFVTQRYHLYRAIYNARALGLNAYGVCAADTESGQLMRDIREVFARAKDVLLTRIDWPPRFLGDPVPLTYPSAQ